MSTVLCQGLQSCVEPQSRTLRLKLASPRPNLCILGSDPEEPKEECHSNGGWSFMRSLSAVTYTSPEHDNDREAPYVHPLDKHWSPTLSERSLALCTENLGSETGSDTSESSIFCFSSWDNVVENFPLREAPKRRERSSARKEARSYPPPLTTMRGSESLRCKPHREGGRLIIKLIKTSPKKSLLRVERTNGRLIISFLKKNNAPDSEENEVKFEENEMSHGEDESDRMGVGGRMGIEKYHMPSSGRCNEDRHGNKEALLNLESFLMATS